MGENIRLAETQRMSVLVREDSVPSHAKVDHWTRTLFDRGFALFALLFFMPFFVVIGLIVVFTEGRPIFFAHERVGRDGKRFKCLKFRTMALDAGQRLETLLASDPAAQAEWDANQKLENDPRITCVGAFLRKSSLDELPQFLNVLRGDMAIVGPRPIVIDEARFYGHRFDEYLSVKPGITGVWQVNGRSTTTYDERVEMDMEYIRNRSFFGDVVIILKTLKVIVTGHGAR